MATLVISMGRIFLSTENGHPREKVFSTQAIISYQCSVGLQKGSDTTSDPGPGNASGTSCTTHWNDYNNLLYRYEWTINGQNFSLSSSNNTIEGNITISNLTKGSKIEVTASLKVSVNYTKKAQRYTRLAYEENGRIQYSSWEKSGNSYSEGTGTITAEKNNFTNLIIFTRPGLFNDYNSIKSEYVIQDPINGLSSTKVYNWCDHCNKFNYWYQQNDNIPSAFNGCIVNSGDIITANWYNNCVSAIQDGTKRPAFVTGGPNGTIITADIIKALAVAISIE